MASEPGTTGAAGATGTARAAAAPVAVALDRASPVPLYFQLARQYEDAIRAGTLAPGARLDTEVRLAERLGLSRPTVRQAIAYLVEQGLIVRRRGVGTQVVHAQIRRPLELTSLYDDLLAAGARPSTRVRAVAETPADDETAAALRVSPGAPVVRLERVRYAGDEPLALLVNLLPVDLVELRPAELEAGGLYRLFREQGVQLHLAEQRIGARPATAAEASLLDEQPGAALLTMTRTAYDHAGHAVEHARHVYRAARYSFELTLFER